MYVHMYICIYLIHHHAGSLFPYSDTAGVRDSLDPIEQEGVKRAINKYGILVCNSIMDISCFC